LSRLPLVMPPRTPRPPSPPLSPYTTLFRSILGTVAQVSACFRSFDDHQIGYAVIMKIPELQKNFGGLRRRDDGSQFDGAPIVSQDRKSTRLNSSHVSISYAVFCLKKKT